MEEHRRDYHKTMAAFKGVFNKRLLPYLRRRTTPGTLTLGAVRIHANLQGGNEIRVQVREADQEPSASLHFVCNLLMGTTQESRVPHDPQVIEHETRLLAELIDILTHITDSSIGKSIRNRPFSN